MLYVVACRCGLLYIWCRMRLDLVADSYLQSRLLRSTVGSWMMITVQQISLHDAAVPHRSVVPSLYMAEAWET